MSSKPKTKATKTKAKAKAKVSSSKPKVPPNTGYRVVHELYPPGRGCYSGQDLDQDYIESCTVRRIVGVYATKAAAIQAARAERRSDCRFDEWADEHYGDAPPPYCSFDGDWNPDDDEDVTICVEDVAAEHKRREAALAKAKASKPPARKKAKVMAHGKAAGQATASAGVGTYAVGTKIRKAFDGKPFDGEVISYDAKAKYYKIRYEDGDEEEMDAKQIKPYLVGAPKMGGDGDDHKTKKASDPKPAAASGPRKFGPQKGNFKPDDNRFMRNPCRISGGEQNLPDEYPGSGKSSFAYLVQRLSDRNYAMRGLCLDNDGAKYTSFAKSGVTQRCLAFLPETDLNDHANDSTIVDAVHLDLINPKSGKSHLTGENFLQAMSADVECIFLNSYDTQNMKSAAIVQAIDMCKDSLKCFSLTEGIVTKDMLAALAQCPSLRGLTLSMTETHAGDADLAPIISSCPEMRWLYIDETSGLFQDASWSALFKDGSCPNLEVLWVESTKGGEGRRNVARGNHDAIRRALNARKETLKLCMINPDDKLKSRYIIGGAKKTDRLNGEKVKRQPSYDFIFGGGGVVYGDY